LEVAEQSDHLIDLEAQFASDGFGWDRSGSESQYSEDCPVSRREKGLGIVHDG